MAASSTSEKIWRAERGGLREALLNAEEREERGELLDAAVMRASAFYSYAHGIAGLFRLYMARYYAEEARQLGSPSAYADLSHGQCDVIGTILLRRALWKAPNPAVALRFFDLGLSKANVPPHSRALLLIGKAEALGQSPGAREQAEDTVCKALALEDEILAERGHVFAMRQFVRVLRRAAVLLAQLGDLESAAIRSADAQNLAMKDPDKDVRDRMVARIEREWARINR